MDFDIFTRCPATSDVKRPGVSHGRFPRPAGVCRFSNFDGGLPSRLRAVCRTTNRVPDHYYCIIITLIFDYYKPNIRPTVSGYSLPRLTCRWRSGPARNPISKTAPGSRPPNVIYENIPIDIIIRVRCIVVDIVLDCSQPAIKHFTISETTANRGNSTIKMPHGRRLKNVQTGRKRPVVVGITAITYLRTRTREIASRRYTISDTQKSVTQRIKEQARTPGGFSVRCDSRRRSVRKRRTRYRNMVPLDKNRKCRPRVNERNRRYGLLGFYNFRIEQLLNIVSNNLL